MSALKLGPLLDDKPVRVTVELPAAVHRDLAAYAEALAGETGQTVEAAKLIAPMLAKFMAADRGFAKGRATAARARGSQSSQGEITGPAAASANTVEPSVMPTDLDSGARGASV